MLFVERLIVHFVLGKKKKGIILLIDVSKKETCNQNISPFNKIARTTVPMTENEPKYFGLYELES